MIDLIRGIALGNYLLKHWFNSGCICKIFLIDYPKKEKKKKESIVDERELRRTLHLHQVSQLKLHLVALIVC